MGKGAGGGTNTVQQSADPWSGAQPYMMEGLHNLQQIYERGSSTTPNAEGFGGMVNTPPYYPGQTVVQPNAWTQGALEAQYNRGAAGSPVTQSAQNENLGTTAGYYLNAGNPALASAINYATAPVEAAANSAFSSAGRYGSGSHVDALSRGIGDISSNMAFQNYNTERDRMQQASMLAPQLAQQDYYDINQAGAAGSAWDAQNQALLNADIDRFNYGQDADWLRTQEFLNTVMGAGGAGSTTRGQTQQGMNPFSTAIGTGLGLAGIGNMLGLFGGAGAAGVGALGASGGSALASALAGALTLSDEDLKWGAERVGTLDNDLPIYKYRYIWEDESQPAHLGVMAQEALEVKPEAVGMLSGFLAVNYDKVTEPA